MPKSTSKIGNCLKVESVIAGRSKTVWARIYGPYGFSPVRSNMIGLLGFNGERFDTVTDYYFLGNGYRAFAPRLMRFVSADHDSPFGEGGLNSYAYCFGDPVNFQDPSGRTGKKFSLHKNPGVLSDKIIIELFRRLNLSKLTPSAAAGASGGGTEKWKVIGYHGSLYHYGPSLANGLDSQFIGGNGYALSGRGFNVATDANIAARHAIGLGELVGERPQLFEVLTPDIKLLRPGFDYTTSAAYGYGLEINIKPQAYDKVKVRMAELRQDVTLLEQTHGDHSETSLR